MSTTYAGDPTNYPEEITIPSDGDGPIEAADVDVPFEGLADRTAALRSLVSAPTFDTKVTLTSATIVKFGADKSWYAAAPGVNDFFIRTQDPYVWPTSTEDISPGAALGDAVYDFAVSPAGTIFGISNTTGTLGSLWRYLSGTWSGSQGVIPYNTTYPSIVYESVSALWCAVFLEESSVPRIVTSPGTGASAAVTAWTLRTSPTGLPADALSTLCTDGAGVIVLQAFSAATPSNMYTSRSTDGGVTWSACVVTALGFDCFLAGGGARPPSPVWTGFHFVYVAPSDSAETKVYTSTAGATMTLVATLNDVGIFRVAAIGRTIVGVTSTNWIVTSFDEGATWQYGTRKMASSILWIGASPAQFMFTQSGFCYPSNARAGIGAVT